MLTREGSDHAFFIFRRYDEDNSGSLSPDEMRKLLSDYSLGVRLTDEEADLAVRLVAKNASGSVSYRDFAEWWRREDRFQRLQWTPDELAALRICRERFAALDRDGNGLVSRSEFRALHKALRADGFDVPEDLDECFRRVDRDGSGAVDFEEFVAFLREIDAFRKREQRAVERRAEEAAERALPSDQYVEKVLARTNYAVLKAWSKYDVDKSSSISASELRRLARDLGFHMSEEESRTATKLLAKRGGEEIEFGDFKEWYLSEGRCEIFKWSEEELAKFAFFRDIYDEHDADQSGLIEGAEFGALHAALVARGFVLPPPDECLRAMGAAAAQRVSFNAFVQFLKTTGAFKIDWSK